jgi:hypothetical protein
MMFRRQIYDAHRHWTLPIEKSLIEREMIPNRLPVHSPRQTRRVQRDFKGKHRKRRKEEVPSG